MKIFFSFLVAFSMMSSFVQAAPKCDAQLVQAELIKFIKQNVDEDSIMSNLKVSPTGKITKGDGSEYYLTYYSYHSEFNMDGQIFKADVVGFEKKDMNCVLIEGSGGSVSPVP